MLTWLYQNNSVYDGIQPWDTMLECLRFYYYLLSRLGQTQTTCVSLTVHYAGQALTTGGLAEFVHKHKKYQGSSPLTKLCSVCHKYLALPLALQNFLCTCLVWSHIGRRNSWKIRNTVMGKENDYAFLSWRCCAALSDERSPLPHARPTYSKTKSTSPFPWVWFSFT